MAAKANKNRTRLIRSAILSASVLSIVPLIGLMQQGEAGDSINLTASLDSMAVQPDIAFSNSSAVSTAATTVSVVPVSMPTTSTATETSAAVATTSKSTTTQTTTQASYTRTKAS